MDGGFEVDFLSTDDPVVDFLSKGDLVVGFLSKGEKAVGFLSNGDLASSDVSAPTAIVAVRRFTMR